jgi:hypothetical protein
MSRTYSAEERAARRRKSSNLSSIDGISSSRFLRSGTDSLGIRLSSLATASEASKKRFSIEDEFYSINPITGLPVMNSIEDMQRRRWEKEKEDDSLKFDPDGTSEAQRQQNYEWAIKMCQEEVGQLQHQVIEQQEESCPDVVEDAETYPKCDPPPSQPLPPLDQLNLDQNPTTDPRELGFLPPSLPHSFLDIVPKWSRERVGGIFDGELVYGTYEEGIESCDPQTRIVYCVNARENNCGCLLRCNRSASLVRCPKCNTVSPAGPELLGDK